MHDKNKVARIFKIFIPFTFFGEFWPFFSNHSPFACSSARPPEAEIFSFTMSILHSSARPSGASRRSREALLTARRGPVEHRATTARAVKD